MKQHNDIIQWATLTDLSPTIEQISWDDPSYMYLERVPTQWLAGIDIHDGLGLRRFDPTLPFNQWERGQIFCPDFELRWEKQQGRYQTVYIGQAQTLADFQSAPEPILDDTQQIRRQYYLWGKKVQDEDLDQIGAANQEQQRAFAQLGIPRVLYYPVSPDAEQVQLEVCEYMDTSNVRVYYRFLQLQELEGG